MKMLVKKIIAYFKFYKHNKKKFNYLNNLDTKTLVMVEFFQYFPSILAFSHYIEVLTKNFSAKPILYDPAFARSFFKHYLFLIRCLINPYFYLYRSLGIRKIILTKKENKFVRKSNEFYNNRLINASKLDFENLKINNIYIGDLLYDEYLRSNNKPTIDLENPRFKEFVKKFLISFYFWEDFFNKKSRSINSMIVSHTVYLIGLMSRIAVSKDISVYSVGNANSNKINKKNIYKFDDTKYFKKTFSKLDTKSKKEFLKIGELSINGRIGGKIDKKTLLADPTENKVFGSNKRKNKLFKNTGRPRVLIATHCFTDAVHFYGKSLFPDFFEWVNDIGKLSEIYDYDWYIKFHPSEFDGNRKHFQYFLDKYKKLILLPKDTKNNVIFKEKVDAVISIYGSVGHEYPLFNIPVINAASIGPHANYSFNYHPKSIKEYHKLIKNIKKLKINKEEVKKEIYEYNYMRYESNFELLKDLKGVFVRLKKNFATPLIFDEYFSYYSIEYNNIMYQNILNFIKSKELKHYKFNISKPEDVDVLF